MLPRTTKKPIAKQAFASAIVAACLLLGTVQFWEVARAGHLDNPNSVEVLSTATGDGVIRTLDLTFSPRSIALDADEKVYVAGDDAVSVFPAGAADSARPIATISGPRTLLREPNALWVAPDRRLYVAEPNNVMVFGPGAAGNKAPERLIHGSGARVSTYPLGLVLDSRGFIYVADSDGVEVYSPSSSGNSPPIDIIARHGFKVIAESIDTHDNLYVLEDPFVGAFDNADDRISVYDLRNAGIWKRTRTFVLKAQGLASWLAVAEDGKILVADDSLPNPVWIYSPPSIGPPKLESKRTTYAYDGRFRIVSATDHNANVYIGTFVADHDQYGPVRLLMTSDEIERKLGRSTPIKRCYGSGPADCEDELRYTDGQDSLTIAYTYIHLKRGEHGSGFTHLKPGTEPIAGWRWEGLSVFAMPPSRILGWPVCDGGWDNRGYCGGPGEDPRGIELNFVIKRSKVVEVFFGSE
jgi:hypothetical protein